MSRNFNWIWFFGAAVWFFDAALGMHHGSLSRGIGDAAVAALFLALGFVFRRLNRSGTGRNPRR